MKKVLKKAGFYFFSLLFMIALSGILCITDGSILGILGLTLTVVLLGLIIRVFFVNELLDFLESKAKYINLHNKDNE